MHLGLYDKDWNPATAIGFLYNQAMSLMLKIQAQHRNKGYHSSELITAYKLIDSKLAAAVSKLEGIEALMKAEGTKKDWC